MNFYEHHLGDYLRDTAHLTMLEDAAYRRLLDVYYVRERPLPLDIKQCCKLARAQAPAEREAVEAVLAEFFTLTEDGYHQARADDEVERFQTKQRKAKASADARWSQSVGNASAMPPHSERNATASKPHMPSQSEGNALQSPVPNLNPKRPVDNGDNSAQRARLPMEGAGAAKPKGLERADLKELLADLQPGRERTNG